MDRPRSQVSSAPALLRTRFAVVASFLGLCAFLLLFAPARANEETIIKAHGISAFGDLKYPEGFAHFDYVNPDAPKGGTFSTWAFGTFDSLSPYILKGQSAALAEPRRDRIAASEPALAGRGALHRGFRSRPAAAPVAVLGHVAAAAECPRRAGKRRPGLILRSIRSTGSWSRQANDPRPCRRSCSRTANHRAPRRVTTVSERSPRAGC